MFTQYDHGVQGINRNCCMTAPGLRIAGGAASEDVDNANTFSVRNNGYFSAPKTTTAIALTGPNLAFDDGTVPATTGSCRFYTILATVSTTTGGITFSVVYGDDFTKHAPATENYLNFGPLGLNSAPTIVGFVYVKNESTAVFIPGTTHLDAAGITARFIDAFGFVVA
jgi:hypothetical protein